MQNATVRAGSRSEALVLTSGCLIPRLRSKRAAVLSTVRALRTSAPIREADEVIGSLYESATVRSDCDGA
jgi:hypothetical protein